jgi:hypothetical protein
VPLIRSYPEAPSLQPTDAFVIDRNGIGTLYIEATGIFLSGAPYEASCSFFGAIPNSDQLIGAHFFGVATTYLANFVTPVGIDGVSGGGCIVNPTATFTAVVKKLSGGVQTDIGTMGISTGGTLSFITSATDFAAGDSIQFFGPASADASITDIWWTILGAVQ